MEKGNLKRKINRDFTDLYRDKNKLNNKSILINQGNKSTANTSTNKNGIIDKNNLNKINNIIPSRNPSNNLKSLFNQKNSILNWNERVKPWNKISNDGFPTKKISVVNRKANELKNNTLMEQIGARLKKANIINKELNSNSYDKLSINDNSLYDKDNKNNDNSSVENNNKSINFSSLINENLYCGTYDVLGSILSKAKENESNFSNSPYIIPTEKANDFSKEAYQNSSKSNENSSKYIIKQINNQNCFKILNDKRSKRNFTNNAREAFDIKNLIKSTVSSVEKLNIEKFNIPRRSMSLNGSVKSNQSNIIKEEFRRINKVEIHSKFSSEENNQEESVALKNSNDKNRRSEKIKSLDSLIINEKSSSNNSKKIFPISKADNTLKVTSEFRLNVKKEESDSINNNSESAENYFLNGFDILSNLTHSKNIKNLENLKTDIHPSEKNKNLKNPFILDAIKEVSSSAENRLFTEKKSFNNFITFTNNFRLLENNNRPFNSNFKKNSISFNNKYYPNTENKDLLINDSSISVVEKRNSYSCEDNDSMLLEENLDKINPKQNDHQKDERNKDNDMINDSQEFFEMVMRNPIENKSNYDLRRIEKYHKNLQINNIENFSKLIENNVSASNLMQHKIESLDKIEIIKIDNNHDVITSNFQQGFSIEQNNFEIKNIIQILEEEHPENKDNLQFYLQIKYPYLYEKYEKYEIENEKLSKFNQENNIHRKNLIAKLLENESILENYKKSLNDAMSELNIQEMIRIRLHNQIQQLRGNIRVYVRVKPPTNNSLTKDIELMKTKSCLRYPEKFNNPNNREQIYRCIEIVPAANGGNISSNSINNPNSTINNISLNNSLNNSNAVHNNLANNMFINPNIFNFDRVFPEDTDQEEVFKEIKPFIQSAIDGENVTILAYGATGSGKTHTMQGPVFLDENDVADNASIINILSGVLPRTAEFIFEELKRLEKLNTNQKIYLSAIEIYNENIYDLFDKNTEREPLTTYTNKNNIHIKNLILKEIKSKKDILRFTKEASETRRTDSTIFNESSSRSHAIYQIKIEYFNFIKKETTSGLINIADLAGSEKCTITGYNDKSAEEISSMKKIQNEANFINKSLSTLGRIISIFCNKKDNKMSIPYRESKLTTVLQNSLRPNSKTAMIITIAGDQNSLNSTKESLKFATNSMIAC